MAGRRAPGARVPARIPWRNRSKTALWREWWGEAGKTLVVGARRNVPVDVTDESSIVGAAKTVVDTFGGLDVMIYAPAVGPLSWLPYAAGVLGGSGLGWATYRWSRGAMPQSRWFWLVIFTFLAGLGIGSRFAYGVTHFAGMCTATMAISYKLLAVRGR